jgi:hypothetical protein
MGGKGGLGVIGIAFGFGLFCSLQWPLSYTVLECWQKNIPYSIVVMRESQILQVDICF